MTLPLLVALDEPLIPRLLDTQLLLCFYFFIHSDQFRHTFLYIVLANFSLILSTNPRALCFISLRGINQGAP
jgi:hypothetical protein